MTATATIRVAEGEVKEAVNIAPKYKTLTESCGEPADNLLSIVDGVNNVLDRPNMRWTNWNDHLLNSSPTITFTWDEVYELASIKAWFFGDMNVKAPESVTIAVSEDGENFEEVEFTHDDYQVNQKNGQDKGEHQTGRTFTIFFRVSRQGGAESIVQCFLGNLIHLVQTLPDCFSICQSCRNRS